MVFPQFLDRVSTQDFNIKNAHSVSVKLESKKCVHMFFRYTKNVFRPYSAGMDKGTRVIFS